MTLDVKRSCACGSSNVLQRPLLPYAIGTITVFGAWNMLVANVFPEFMDV